jgi:pimeloyl-ACP methyl ester carboxylesterase
MRGLLGRDFETEHRRLYKANVPVLAVWGKKDDVIPISALGTLTRWNRKAVQEVVEDGGHGLTYTHSAIILETLAETLRDGLR